MTKTGKIIAAAGAAVSISVGYGSYELYQSTVNSSVIAQSVPNAVDDIEAVTVEIPTVEVPKIQAATVSVPEIKIVQIISETDLESLGIPNIELENIRVLTSPGETVDLPETETPEVDSYTDRMPQLIKLQKVQQQLFRDQRNLQYDKNVGLDSVVWKKWISVYQSAEYKNYRMEYVELQKGLRIINEVKCPESTEQFQQLQNRLDYYIKRKYNAVLLTFTTEESLFRLADTLDYLKSLDLKVIIAYSGVENLHESIFRDPDRLAQYLAKLGAKADALLLGWRRTSLHLFLPDKQWTNFLVKNARSQNSSLAVIGMAYFGETAEKLRGVTYDVPENSSAVLIVGLGYPKASTKTAMRKLFPEILNHPHKIGLAVGARPYFDSLHDTGKTKEQNDRIKRRIEIRLLQAGCDSTMTYSGDGSDGHYGRKDRTENLCLPYTK